MWKDATFIPASTSGPLSPQTHSPLITNVRDKGIIMEVVWEHVPLSRTDDIAILKLMCTRLEAFQTYATSK